MLAARWACCSSTTGWWSLIGSSIRPPPGWADGPSGPCLLGSGLAILVLHIGSGRILLHDRAQSPPGLAQVDAHRDLGDTIDQAEQAEQQREGNRADLGRGEEHYAGRDRHQPG